MSEGLETALKLRIMELGIRAAGEMRPGETNAEYAARVATQGAALFAATETRTDREGKVVLSLVEREVVAARAGKLELAGVLVATAPRRDGRKLDMFFLSIDEATGGKFYDPDENPEGGRTYYRSPKERNGLLPAFDVWHGDPWLDSVEGQALKAEAESLIGQPVRYAARRDYEASEKGYRTFERFLGPAEIPEALRKPIAWSVANFEFGGRLPVRRAR